MKLKRPEITLDGLQIKSLEKFQRLAAALTVIEEDCGIRETRITFKNTFFCPWIDEEQCRSTPMERLLLTMIATKN